MSLKRVVLGCMLAMGIFVSLQMQSCRMDDIDASPNLRLSFDTDTLLFDTVFTTVGSSTRYFKVYNKNNSRVNLSNVELAGGTSSYFRINADGRSGTRLQDIEIGPRDSIFVFVEVTVDPVDQDLPMIIADSVIFELNNRRQNVKLVAWGQDANFITPNYIDTVNEFAAHVILEDTKWSGPKPYVVYGIVIVAPGVTLTVEKGTNVHLHHRSLIAFDTRASFKVQGTIDEPVIFQGDRLESMYEDLPGQWGFIWLSATSRNHEIDYAIIKNGTYGIIMDSIGSLTKPTLTIRNSIIKNMDQTGLELNGAWVEASNTVIANCGAHAIMMRFGGNYDFRHVTVANFYNLIGSIRQTPSVVINNYYKDTLENIIVRPLEKVYFGNSIVYGSLQEEVLIDYYPDNNDANYLFDHCLVKTTLNIKNATRFENSLFNRSPKFNDVSENDYRLQEDSPVIGIGKPEIALEFPTDILGNSRLDSVDLGAYQYYEIQEDSLTTKSSRIFYHHNNQSTGSESVNRQLQELRRRFRLNRGG
jgi:hypothetical protein